MTDLETLRARIRAAHLADEQAILDSLIASSAPSGPTRAAIVSRATSLIEDIRSGSEPGLMEVFLAEYGLSTEEGVALMCLAEALLRVPDAETIDALIEDKIAPSSWGEHLGKSSSSLVNASTWGLMLTGKVLDDEDSRGVARVLHGAVKRLGEPVIRVAVKQAMKEMGRQFVLGETISKAMKRAAAMEKKGFTYSYDMLGEAALTAADADTYFKAYSDAISAISKAATHDDIRDNPGISIKLSALHPRYEVAQTERVMTELVPRVLDLALAAKDKRMGLNIDAEEADRLDLSLDIIERVLSDKRLAGWGGFGVVVQAYSKRAAPLIDWLHTLAETLDRKIMVRLVKGAYWDSEIKRAQVEGLESFPLFTRKAATDVSYICCAKKLLGMAGRIYPQFATHNAHTISAILQMAGDKPFEFQRLHGMGEAVHTMVLQREGTRCRNYAPVGAHRDLLAYLVRRLLENGANSSFVNQIVDEELSAAEIAVNPFEQLSQPPRSVPIALPENIYAPSRKNSKGWDTHDLADLADIETARAPFMADTRSAGPMLACKWTGGDALEIRNPARPDDHVGDVREATEDDVNAAIKAARDWSGTSPKERADILRQAADLYEDRFGEIFALLTREAGKTIPDAIAELREAVDFLRFYAAEAERRGVTEPRGIFACISPWNFPLAIFTGQIAAALAAGNGVIAKPAETTPLIASLGVQLMLDAGVQKSALQLLPGQGAVVGAAMTSNPKINGVCFTGSTTTAQIIHRAMAQHLDPGAPLIAETGGLNAMIVDSTALPQQAVTDIVSSAFQSAGQRCSALRMLYVQEDVIVPFMKMLYGAMDELTLGDPWHLSTDVGPVIDRAARSKILDHVSVAEDDGRVLKRTDVPLEGTFVPPVVISVTGIEDLEEEIFGPVLHVASFDPKHLDKVIGAINAKGYGLTFGLHTRIDDRVEDITQDVRAGNIYVNRNQIGAVVGSQPFGGEGLSGTGPKAGGPDYMARFMATEEPDLPWEGDHLLDPEIVQRALDALPPTREDPLATTDLPGPTGESNRLSTYPRGPVLCLGPGAKAAKAQAAQARAMGCPALVIAPSADGVHALSGILQLVSLTHLTGFAAVAMWGDHKAKWAARIALAARQGPILPLITASEMSGWCVVERHVCIDTTASGGNVSLLAASA